MHCSKVFLFKSSRRYTMLTELHSHLPFLVILSIKSFLNLGIHLC